MPAPKDPAAYALWKQRLHQVYLRKMAGRVAKTPQERCEKYRLSHPERVKNSAAQYKARHRERILARARQRYQDRIEHFRAKRIRSYYANRELENEKGREWRRKNPEKQKQCDKNWREKYPERVRAKELRRTPEEIRQKARKRNALKKLCRHERYDEAAIFRRDCFTCQLCFLSVDMTLRFPHKMSATIDHIIPLVAGGADAPDNVQLAHAVCNFRKGKKILHVVR